MRAEANDTNRGEACKRAFTLVELIVMVALMGFLALLLLPAMAHLQPSSHAVQCQNNLRQISRAWKMYADDNNGRIVSAYPAYGGFTATWCKGSAQSGGEAGSYTYGGADPAGIQSGLLWPYINSLEPYHCPTDHRIANGANVPAQFKGKPILRSIAMNSFMGGTGLGQTGWTPLSPFTPRDPIHPVYLKESEIRIPAASWLVADEDQESINDGMLYMDVGGSRRFLDLPSRAHRFGYGISFADGHTEIYQFTDDSSKRWYVGQPGGLNDWMRLTNVTTHPL